MKIEDIVESAGWLTGTETPADRVRYEQDVAEAMDYLCAQEGLSVGPVRFTEKRPGAEDVPPVPDHISGPAVRLLVGESTITGRRPRTSVGSFVANLDKIDLDRLRRITRKAHSRTQPTILNDQDCDEIIEQIGPEAALDTLRKTVH
jgi:hypothetical protein